MNEGAVLVIDFEWILPFHVQAQLSEPMGQRVLIDLFQVAVLVVRVKQGWQASELGAGAAVRARPGRHRRRPACSKQSNEVLHPDVRLPQNGPQGAPDLLIPPTTALPACLLARAGRLPARQQCNLQSPPGCSGSIPHAWRLGTRNRAGSGTPPPSSRPRRDESGPAACKALSVLQTQFNRGIKESELVVQS